MPAKNKIEVLIGGKVYTLVGVESEEYMQRIALYIDKKINEVTSKESSRVLSTNMLAVLTSINVADDLFKALEQIDILRNEIQHYKKELDEYKSRKDVSEQIEQYENKLKTKNDDIIELNTQIDDFMNEMEKLEAENQEYEKLLEETQLELLRCKEELSAERLSKSYKAK